MKARHPADVAYEKTFPRTVTAWELQHGDSVSGLRVEGGGGPAALYSGSVLLVKHNGTKVEVVTCAGTARLGASDAVTLTARKQVDER